MQEKMPFSYESPQQVRDLLESMAEPKYRDFAASLLPGEPHVLGVRLPKLRALAKTLARSGGEEWLHHEEDFSFEETMLRGMVIGCLRKSRKPCLPCAGSFCLVSITGRYATAFALR